MNKEAIAPLKSVPSAVELQFGYKHFTSELVDQDDLERLMISSFNEAFIEDHSLLKLDDNTDKV